MRPVNVFLRSVSIDGRVGRTGRAGRAGNRSGGRNPMGNSAGSAPRRTAGQPAFCGAVDVRSSGFRPTGECCARARTAAGPRQGPPPRFRTLRDPRRDRALEAAVRGLRRAGGFAMRPHGRRLLASLDHGTRPGERFCRRANNVRAARCLTLRRRPAGGAMLTFLAVDLHLARRRGRRQLVGGRERRSAHAVSSQGDGKALLRRRSIL